MDTFLETENRNDANEQAFFGTQDKAGPPTPATSRSISCVLFIVHLEFCLIVPVTDQKITSKNKTGVGPAPSPEGGSAPLTPIQQHQNSNKPQQPKQSNAQTQKPSKFTFSFDRSRQ